MLAGAKWLSTVVMGVFETRIQSLLVMIHFLPETQSTE